MGRKKHKQSRPWKAKPVWPTTPEEVAKRLSNSKPEFQDLRIKPYGSPGMGRVIGVDFGAIEARVVLHYGGRRIGKTEAQSVWARTRGIDTPIEPLGAGVSRILSRGAPAPVRYPYGG